MQRILVTDIGFITVIERNISIAMSYHYWNGVLVVEVIVIAWPSRVLRGSIICSVLRYKQCHLHNQWRSFLRHIRILTQYFPKPLNQSETRAGPILPITVLVVSGMLMCDTSQTIHHWCACVRCVSPTRLMTWPTPGARCMTPAVTVTRRTRWPRVPETPGEPGQEPLLI